MYFFTSRLFGVSMFTLTSRVATIRPSQRTFMTGLFFLSFFGPFFGPFYRGGGGKAHHYFSGRGGMKSISTEGGVGGRVLLLREG